jgi:AcrR family transcriptional regulator
MKNVQFELKKALFKTRLGIPEHRQFTILETALELIQENGFEQLQFGDLAKRCKMSRSLVHHYFRDKNALANRLLDLSTLLLQNHAAKALAKEKNKSRQFEVYCKATLSWAAESPREAIGLMLFIYISSHNLEMRKRNDELSATGRQKIKSLISQISEEYQNLDSKAEVIQTILTGCYIRLISENLSPAESRQLRAKCLENCVSLAVSK